MITKSSASGFCRKFGSKEPRSRQRAAFKPERLLLEDRCLFSDGVPVPTTNPVVNLSTIIWNGEPTPLNPGGKMNIPSPASAGRPRPSPSRTMAPA